MAVSVSRKDLYDQVWAEPMTAVARKYGLSDRGLAKLCERNGIPVPPRGWWARKQAGQKVKQTKLPADLSRYPERIHVQGAATLPEEMKKAMEAAREKQQNNEPQVREFPGTPLPIDSLHRAVKATARALRKARPDEDGLVRAQDPGHCGVVTSPASAERAIYILDTLARMLDGQGLSLQPADTNMKVANATDELTISLTERIQRQKHVPTEAERAKEEKLREKRQRDARHGIWNYSFERSWPEFDYILTGELGIEIANEYVSGARRSWRDGKTQKVEGLVDEIVLGIVAYLEGLRLRREERERWQREYEESKRQQALAVKRKEREELRCGFVNALAEKMTETEKLKVFLDKLPSGSVANDEVRRMAEWTRDRITRLELDLQRDNIAATLRQNGIFPEADDLIS